MRIIRPITIDTPYDHWLQIWNESEAKSLPDTVRATTWSRLIDEDVPLFGFMAYIDDNTPVGFLHYALHPISGAIEPAAYMQDLFILPKYRRRGFARVLLDNLVKAGQTEQWDRILWLVEQGNEGAEKLYNDFGMTLAFQFYIYPIAMLKRLMN